MECLESQLKLESWFLGYEIVLEGIKKGKVKLIIVARDASEKTKNNLTFTSEKFKIPLIIFGDIDTNSKAIGKKGRAVIGVIDSGLANKIQELISGGET